MSQYDPTRYIKEEEKKQEKKKLRMILQNKIQNREQDRPQNVSETIKIKEEPIEISDEDPYGPIPSGEPFTGNVGIVTEIMQGMSGPLEQYYIERIIYMEEIPQKSYDLEASNEDEVELIEFTKSPVIKTTTLLKNDNNSNTTITSNRTLQNVNIIDVDNEFNTNENTNEIQHLTNRPRLPSLFTDRIRGLNVQTNVTNTSSRQVPKKSVRTYPNNIKSKEAIHRIIRSLENQMPTEEYTISISPKKVTRGYSIERLIEDIFPFIPPIHTRPNSLSEEENLSRKFTNISRIIFILNYRNTICTLRIREYKALNGIVRIVTESE